MKKPNFLIIGLARSGTTSLYHYLKQHPSIFLTEKKEPKYFSSINRKFPHLGKGDLNIDNSRIYKKNEYYQLFETSSNQIAIGEASSDYFYYIDECLPEILSELGENTKIIICLRDPYERAFSAYNNLLRDSRETLSFREGLLKEKKRKEMNFDWMWLYKEGSLYFEKIKLVKEKFHKVHIVYFKEFVNQTEKSLKEVCNFLGVSDLFLFDTRVKYSPSGKPKNFVFKHLSKRYGIFYKIRKRALYLLPREILERISNKFFKKYEIQKSEIQLIKRCINQDVDKLTELLGKDLSHWKK